MLDQPTNPTLFTRNFVLMSVASFLMFFSFYLLMPIIALYIIERFNTDISVAGVVVSAYIITALLARPFSGFLVDRFDRKRLYILTYLVFTLLFLGYIFASSTVQFLMVRILFGATFSLVTTAGSTLAIDVLPSSRRNEGIGYMGAITVLAMAVGPMLGLYLREIFSFQGLFIFSMISCSLGVLTASFVRTTPRPKVIHHGAISLDRFFLSSAVSMALVTAILNFPYGTMMSYMPLMLKESGLDVDSGGFFMYLAVGVIISRVFGGKLLNKGYQSILIQVGMSMLVVAISLFVFYLNEYTFIISSLMIGLSYGAISPSIQSLIINLVPHSRRGTANSTYFIALDFGSGMGMLLGGYIANAVNFRFIYLIGLILIVIAFLVFKLYAMADYNKKLALLKQDCKS